MKNLPIRFKNNCNRSTHRIGMLELEWVIFGHILMVEKLFKINYEL